MIVVAGMIVGALLWMHGYVCGIEDRFGPPRG